MKAYKEWAEANVTSSAPLPDIKPRRIDESAKLVFQTAAEPRAVLDVHHEVEKNGGGIAFDGHKFKLKASRPFRQRRLNDHMGGIKYAISKVGADHVLKPLDFSPEGWQWDATFEQGQVSGGKMYYNANGRPQIVARLSLDSSGAGKLTRTDNNVVFPSAEARVLLSRF